MYDHDGEERFFSGHSGRLFLLLTFGFFCIKLSQRLLPPLLPEIITDLGITAFLGGVGLTIMRISRAAAEYPSGRFADQLTRTTVLIVCLASVLLGIGILTVSMTYVVFLVGITILGIGLGMYNPASRALLSDVFEEKRGRALGLHMAGSSFSGMLAAGIAIWIVPIASWRAAFLPVLLILFPVPFVLYFLSNESFQVKTIDLEVRKTGGRLLRNPTNRWLLIVYSLFVMASGGMTSFLPTFLIEVHGASFAFASSAFALIYAVGLFAKPLGGATSDRFPRLMTAGVSLFLASAGIGILVTVPFEGAAIAGVIVYAIGNRSVPPTLQAYLIDQFPDQSKGGDLGAMRAIYLAIGSFGPVYTGFVISTWGFTISYVTLLLFLAVGGAIVLAFHLLD